MRSGQKQALSGIILKQVCEERTVTSCFLKNTILITAVLTAGCAGVRPPDLGIEEGRLVPCPQTPNCVSSQSPDEKHYVDPLRFSTSSPVAESALTKIISGMKHARIADAKASYIHAEFTSALFRFIDDVEFYVDTASRRIHIRSASRLGRFDFGANRRRVDAIREQWNALSR